jgi:hypothetical protein
MLSINLRSRLRAKILSLENQGDRRQDNGGDDGFDVDRSRLPANLLQLRRVGDGLRALVHVAQTARRESYSRLIARLKKAERSDVEKKNERQSPDEWRADADQQSCYDCADGKSGNPE